MSALSPLPASLPAFLQPYLPAQAHAPDRPFVTLTYAQSLDSRIAAQPGTRTHISHAETKTMTHYLRAQHDAILVGINTVLADDPALNCRYGDTGAHQIRPIIVDPGFRFAPVALGSRLLANLRAGTGLKPIVVVSSETPLGGALHDQVALYVDIMRVPPAGGTLPWEDILGGLKRRSINSVMVEGGACIINTLLNTSLVDSLIVTVGPVYLGAAGVQVSPASPVRLARVTWWTGVQDSVLCATIDRNAPQ